jgi:hypothetical protein
MARPTTNRWPPRLLRLQEIERAVETGEGFRRPRPGYRPRDPAIAGGIIIESF